VNSRNGHDWAPSELQQLLLRAALLDGRPALEAWAASRERTSDVQTLEVASYRLLPLLYRNLLDLAAEDPLMDRLKGVYRYSWYCNQRLFHSAAKIIELLEGWGVPTMVVKGGALAPLHYRDIGARPMDDVDILVPLNRVRETVEMLEREGWTRDMDIPFEYVLRTRHSWGFRHSSGLEFDLHWHSTWLPGPPGETLWEDAVPLVLGEAETRALDPAHQLIQVCGHGISFFAPAAHWVPDAVVLIRSGIDWDRLIQLAREREVTAMLAYALAHVRDEFQAAIPPSVLDELEASPRTRSERWAQRVIVNRPRHGGHYVAEWDRYRRQARLEGTREPPVTGSGYH
jgi:hypothetical protein